MDYLLWHKYVITVDKGPNYYCQVLSSVINSNSYTVFAEIFVVVLISDVMFIAKFKKLNNWRCRGQHANLVRLFRN